MTKVYRISFSSIKIKNYVTKLNKDTLENSSEKHNIRMLEYAFKSQI